MSYASRKVPRCLYKAILREGDMFGRRAAAMKWPVASELSSMCGRNDLHRVVPVVHSAIPELSTTLVDSSVVKTVIRHAFDASRNANEEESRQCIQDGFSLLRYLSQRNAQLLTQSHSTVSDTLSGSCRVHVSSFPVAEQSHPAESYYAFGFKVCITNESQVDTIQLIKRHWSILDKDGRPFTEVEGTGVVGKCPIIEPGASFKYTSGCALHGSSGTMQGRFTMLNLSDRSEFVAKVSPFRLDSTKPAKDEKKEKEDEEPPQAVISETPTKQP